jgi:hypothetical protein
VHGANVKLSSNQPGLTVELQFPPAQKSARI